jgi:hypothetical protein
MESHIYKDLFYSMKCIIEYKYIGLECFLNTICNFKEKYNLKLYDLSDKSFCEILTREFGIDNMKFIGEYIMIFYYPTFDGINCYLQRHIEDNLSSTPVELLHINDILNDTFYYKYLYYLSNKKKITNYIDTINNENIIGYIPKMSNYIFTDDECIRANEILCKSINIVFNFFEIDINIKNNIFIPISLHKEFYVNINTIIYIKTKEEERNKKLDELEYKISCILSDQSITINRPMKSLITMNFSD